MNDTDSPASHGLRRMVLAALDGLDAARQRLEAATMPGAPTDVVFVPLAEALWWIVSANDGFEDLADDGELQRWLNRDAYRQERDQDSSGRVLTGLRYARDRCGHQLALTALEDGLRLPFRLPNSTGTFFRWRPSDQLPQPRNRNYRAQAERTRPAYETWLAGRPVTTTIESAAKWFAHVAQQSGIREGDNLPKPR